ncbi:hypothetical protein [Silanimonas sp.]|uniref:hypothetical protein n=1 Tax=Silanimonas sp. TaxID=1929290 RepID=UPI0022C3920B|nr:hypothetical protein [Silanimonas sp.]MCZ8165591.1 hypothetical protein [Silanimonas sp.]
MIENLAGGLLALDVGLSASSFGFDKDRSFYPVILIVVASYYVLAAAIAGSNIAFSSELAVFLVFLGVAVIGSKRRPLLVAAGLIAQGIYEIFHSHIVDNPGVPIWSQGFRLSFDFTAGTYLIGLFAWRRRRKSANVA